MNNRIELLESRIAPAALAAFNLISLNGLNGFVVPGKAANDQAGASVSGAGDVNGDGFDDIIIGAAHAQGRTDGSGSSYVVFGHAGGSPGAVTPAALDGANGFEIRGARGDASGFSVSSAGDVNGDGFGDLIVGAPLDGFAESSFPPAYRGAAYVVFGRAQGFGSRMELATLGGGDGFKIVGDTLVGTQSSSGFGMFVSGAGDVNGDGFDDVVIGAPHALPTPNVDPFFSPDPLTARGASYVVFGRAAVYTAPIQASTLDGTNGFKISGMAEGDFSGTSVSGIGDFNGDGYDDIAIGASDRHPASSPDGGLPGPSYVIFGKQTGFGAALDLATVNGGNGFKIEVESTAGSGHRIVSGAGDVNGDGRPDLIIGDTDASASYVILGRTGSFNASFNLTSLNGTNGFKIQQDAVANLHLDNFGLSVSSGGDLNGDGFGDLIIGAQRGGTARLVNNGAGYVVFVKASAFPSTLVLSGLSPLEGFKVEGLRSGDYAGTCVSGVSDVNGDGFDDFIIGAPFADAHGSNSGATYVIFGGKYVGALAISKNGRIATFTDNDGDAVTVKTTQGAFTMSDFTLVASGSGARLQLLDLHGQSALAGANISIGVKTPRGGAGDGAIFLDRLDATGIDLGAVKLAAVLGEIDAGDGNAAKPAVRSLRVYGLEPSGGPAQSDIAGDFGALTVEGPMTKVTLAVAGKLGAVIADERISDTTIRAAAIKSIAVTGDSSGDIEHTTIAASGTFGTLKVAGSFTDSKLLVMGTLNPDTAAKAVAIRNVAIKGHVSGSQILAGYNAAGEAKNGEASIGTVSVGGIWSGSDLVAGIADSTGDGFGRNDTLIDNGSIAATIASLTIKGGAVSSPVSGDSFGITAEVVRKAKVGGVLLALTNNSKEDLAVTDTGDLQLVEV